MKKVIILLISVLYSSIFLAQNDNTTYKFISAAKLKECNALGISLTKDGIIFDRGIFFVKTGTMSAK